MSTRITAVTLTDPGRVRERNEDSALVFVPAPPQDDTALLIVADGMGGYKAGDRASQLAVETIRAELEPLFVPTSAQPTKKLPPSGSGDRSTVELPETASNEHYSAFITRAVRRANEVITGYGQAHREARGLGSTVTMVLIVRNRAYFANVGDSRTYLFRAGELRPITRDHSLVAKLVEAGEIEPDDVYVHPKRNLIYRSLGADRDETEVDLFEEDVQTGDVFVLCSDGLWEKMRSPDIVDVLTNSADLATAARFLIDLANANGGEDNITVALARVESATDPATPSSDISEVDTGEFETPTVPLGK